MCVSYAHQPTIQISKPIFSYHHRWCALVYVNSFRWWTMMVRTENKRWMPVKSGKQQQHKRTFLFISVLEPCLCWLYTICIIKWNVCFGSIIACGRVNKCYFVRSHPFKSIWMTFSVLCDCRWEFHLLSTKNQNDVTKRYVFLTHKLLFSVSLARVGARGL